MKKSQQAISLLLTASAIILLSACTQNLPQNTESNTQGTQTEESTQQLIGGQTDAGGCLTGAGYRWCDALNKCVRVWEESCADLVMETMTDMEKVIAIKFSEPKDAEFVWKINKNDKIKDTNIKGKSFEINNISTPNYDKIGTYFLDNGFNPDIYNAAAGVNQSIDAYAQTKIGLVCTVDSIIKKTIKNVTVSCGMTLQNN
jgi:hypothetical protein